MLSITKLRNLKAIHNCKGVANIRNHVVINHKTTKFESNSQLSGADLFAEACCYQSQNYKIWKQFTTTPLEMRGKNKLLSIKKTTKFEINSQQYLHCLNRQYSCYQSQNYKIWKQFTTLWVPFVALWVLLSITKLQNLKAIHNPYYRLRWSLWLLSITKLQNLKAIHNHKGKKRHIKGVVINHKTTKFESNSQLG